MRQRTFCQGGVCDGTQKRADRRLPNRIDCAGLAARAWGVVQVKARDGKLQALDAAGGELLRQYEAGGSSYSSPTVEGGVVNAMASKWTERVEEGKASRRRVGRSSCPANSTLCRARAVREVAPMTTDRAIPPILRRLRPLWSVLLWRHQVDGALGSFLIVAGEAVYVSSQHGEIFAFDAAAGTPLWRLQLDETTFAALPVTEGTVYAGLRSGDLYALDADSGTLLWRYAIGGVGFSAPAAAGGAV